MGSKGLLLTFAISLGNPMADALLAASARQSGLDRWGEALVERVRPEWSKDPITALIVGLLNSAQTRQVIIKWTF